LQVGGEWDMGENDTALERKPKWGKTLHFRKKHQMVKRPEPI